MNKYEIINKIERFAPPENQETWDCSGWIVDNKKQEVKQILFALTVTDDIVEQARQKKCDMIISHHPLFFVPLNYFDINIYCAHTNLDKAHGGTTDVLIKNLGYKGIPFNDYVRIVKLDKPMTINNIRKNLEKISPKLRYVNNTNIEYIQTIGFCAGSGTEFINDTPCDAFITGDLKFHCAVESKKIIFDIGHFESEIFVVKLLKELSEVGEKGIIADEKSPFI